MNISTTRVYITECLNGDGETDQFVVASDTSSPKPIGIIHECELISVSNLSNIIMGCGTGKPCKVIHNNKVKEYVGIGWIVEKEEASISDYFKYPIAV